jgi:hypothetical protein
MILATRVASLLKIQQSHFSVRNLTLTRVVVASSPINQHVPWEIRPHVSKFRKITEAIPHADLPCKDRHKRDCS